MNHFHALVRFNIFYSALRAPSALEILGEKALTQGHIDLLLKHRIPIGSSVKIPIEVKTAKAQMKDLAQLRGYMDELLGECKIGILIAAEFSKDTVRNASGNGIHLVRYILNSDLKKSSTFEEICAATSLETLGR
jgi:RecB family endonuclease NucS